MDGWMDAMILCWYRAKGSLRRKLKYRAGQGYSRRIARITERNRQYA